MSAVSHGIIAIFFILGIVLHIVALSIGKLLRPHQPAPDKAISYESGVDPTGDSWIQFNVRYYLFALLFVIFDVEAVFLYPWAAGYDVLRSEVGLFILVEMVLFVFFLILGLLYAWKKKVLEWE
ncbi:MULTISPECIES: NADH-quinone oxidoreductase subunit A [Thermoactinomyces]|mgnify:CR=1 FL=1|uniref:NADH-quinone oxidoreductase subunit A n=1 Tax=Thermoactinomyces vulgaris TaxID=2026 RepID=A0ABS0QH88_THEVU|nr:MULTISPECIES: NADH-quinone oxidoreductase subunit A [Thermoactinomyces]KFZ39943.1 NADH:ubiquinone oxidoreductase subunit A [Thermoactinomyces sp. Gus2-1]KYQ86195.1 NADH:ubiquinone oxidoreductase subunit A [Thermoactinomyces sp. AS95]MBA4551052.1 NADH-quinone oxidoreductase subunit A [Thermoactinomyces vulgaris]MBA4596989.1 NADH-quinone oxidoreductase subunit A [Thermoactinomyces vulgaris]MBH8583596.1 NADH-quinone oxidoreductase subunit A [Thermoactinomyces sp. CICC 10735]